MTFFLKVSKMKFKSAINLISMDLKFILLSLSIIDLYYAKNRFKKRPIRREINFSFS